MSTTANSSPPSRASVSPSRSAPLQPLGDDLEQLVAVVVPERVVDLLEAVEVDEQHRDRALRAHALDRALDALVEERAVRQAGERVVEGEVAQPPRRAGDDPEQHRVEQREADAEEEVERALLAAGSAAATLS